MITATCRGSFSCDSPSASSTSSVYFATVGIRLFHFRFVVAQFLERRVQSFHHRRDLNLDLVKPLLRLRQMIFCRLPHGLSQVAHGGVEFGSQQRQHVVQVFVQLRGDLLHF